MINWCKQNTILLLITSSFWSGQSSGVADSIVTNGVECHNVNTAYQEVYGFETENYYINICQLDDEFFYYRQSKLDASNKLLIPAESILRGDVFQATAGKTTYFVGIESDRYYSSVMSNNNEIVFEPEILPTAAIALETLPLHVEEQSSLSADYSFLQEEDKILSNTKMSLDYPEAASEDEELLICTQEKAAFHPHLAGWQKLIGKSTISANQYAVENSHDFAYDQENPELALITTQEDETINLSITTNSTNANSGVIEQVCLPATVNNVLNPN